MQTQTQTETKISASGWNYDLTQAPKNTVVLCETKSCQIILAYFNPSWGRGRGAWFNRKNHCVSILSWRADGDYYIKKNKLTEDDDCVFRKVKSISI